MEKINVGVLGCTGMVGQKFIQLLENHPYFVITSLGASERSSGKSYEEATNWKQVTPIPEAIKNFKVVDCDPQSHQGTRVIFSALDASVAGPIEEAFASAGFAVFSNAKNHRMDEDVPICIPFCNPDHMNVIPHQQTKRNYPKGGFIVTNANCSTTGLVVALKPLMDAYGIEKVLVFTMQALSGSGYPGVPSMDVCDNIIPFISGEEEKMEIEPRKILGNFKENSFVDASIDLSAHCNRVQVTDGHTECVSIKLSKSVDPQEVTQILENWSGPEILSSLPSSPARPLVVLKQQDRPQPRLDRDTGRGYTVTVGRVRKCNIFDIKLTLLSHNCVIGAAGGSILNAELAKSKGYL